MTENIRSNSHESGVTITELLVVLVVIAVLASFALMQRGTANEQLNRQNVAQELKTAFERARFDSVKRRADGSELAQVTVTPNSYTLRTYNDDVNGAAVPRNQTTNLPAGIVIGRYDTQALTSIEVTFDRRGETPSSPLPQFYVCNVACDTPTNANANIVIVTPTGTVNLLGGDAELPTFGVPTITQVPNSNGVNPDAVLP